jgi:endonuclease/exonuclease/phosphatase family metal-dependent hydrolase
MNKSSLLMVLMLSFFSFSPNASQPGHLCSPSVKTSDLKILSWNIYMLPYISLFNSNAERARKIADNLNHSDYQIIVFQEAFSSKCRSILAKELLERYPYQYGPANKNHLPFRTNSGLWVLSKIPLTELDEFQFSVCKGFDAVARKGAVLFEGCFNGAKFQLLATHLQAEDSPELRSVQCAEIKEHLLNPYFQKDIPQFICGDFNIDMDDTPNYRQMLQTLDAKNGELSGNVQVTYDEVNNELAYNAKGKKRIIDYVLVRNGGLIDKMERKVQTFFTNKGGSGTYLSDHYAMEFCVNFAEPGNHANAQLITAL